MELIKKLAISLIYVLILAKAQTQTEVAQLVYYVCPDDNPGTFDSENKCNTLTNYTTNHSDYFRNNNTSFYFLPGVHQLNTVIHVESVTSFKLEKWNQGDGYSQVETITEVCCHGTNSGLAFEDVETLSIVGLVFTGCGWHHNISYLDTVLQDHLKTGLYFNHIIDLNLYGVTVQDSVGYGLFANKLLGNSSISNCTFWNNSGTAKYMGGNVAISYIGCKPSNGAKLSITKSGFYNGKLEILYVDAINEPNIKYLAPGLIIYLNCTNVNVLIKNTTLIGNVVARHGNEQYVNDDDSGSGGGNLAIIFYDRNSEHNRVDIISSTFSQGRALVGGAIYVQYYANANQNADPTKPCNNRVKIKGSRFLDNQAYKDGGAVYFQFGQGFTNGFYCNKTNFQMKNCTFRNNSVQTDRDVGLAVRIINCYLNGTFINKYTLYSTKFKQCTFENNFIISYKTDGFVSSGSAVLYVSEQQGLMYLEECTFRHNNVTAISAFRSQLTFAGITNIHNNIAFEGGGMVLCEASYMILTPNTTVNILNNHANKTGGGIYAESRCAQTKPLCFYQIDFSESRHDISNGTVIDELLSTIRINLINNTADYAGSQLYGGTADNCYIPNVHKDIFPNIFPNILNHPTDYSSVTSDPLNVCFCDNGKPICTISYKKLNHTVYSGQSFNISIVTVGQYNGSVPGVVEADVFRNNDLIHIDSYILRDVKKPKCDTLEVKIYTNESLLTVRLLVKNQHANYRLNSKPIFLDVSFNPTPIGFVTLLSDKASEENRCIEKLQREGFHCFINNETILRPPPKWLGYVTRVGSTDCKDFLVHHTCPFDFCQNKDVYIHTTNETFHQDNQCADNREGILCGRCKNGYSLSIASSACINCTVSSTIKHAIVVPAFICTAGLLLLLFLLVFNITVTEGTLNGLLFYINVFFIFKPVFLQTVDERYRHKFLIYVYALNQNYLTDSCFINGLDRLGKMWFQFLYPLYLFLLIGIVIFLSRKWAWFAKRIGYNGVPVLATLLLLSYTTLSQSVIAAISFRYLKFPGKNDDEYTWKPVLLFDGNVPYLSGKHIPLFIVGVLFAFLGLFYTFTLLCIQPLQRYSHLKCFFWVTKFKPLIDAYTCPHIIKPKCRSWYGFLLLMRTFLVLLFATNIHNDPQIQLMGIVTTCVIIQTVAWLLGGIYQKWQLNVLSSSYIINITLLSIITSFILNSATVSRKGHVQLIVTFISLLITLLTFLATIIYHVIQRFKKLCPVRFFPNQHRRMVQPVLLNNASDDEAGEGVPTIYRSDDQYTRHGNPSVPINTTDVRLYREQLLADFDSH